MQADKFIIIEPNGMEPKVQVYLGNEIKVLKLVTYTDRLMAETKKDSLLLHQNYKSATIQTIKTQKMESKASIELKYKLI